MADRSTQSSESRAASAASQSSPAQPFTVYNSPCDEQADHQILEGGSGQYMYFKGPPSVPVVQVMCPCNCQCAEDAYLRDESGDDKMLPEQTLCKDFILGRCNNPENCGYMHNEILKQVAILSGRVPGKAIEESDDSTERLGSGSATAERGTGPRPLIPNGSAERPDIFKKYLDLWHQQSSAPQHSSKGNTTSKPKGWAWCDILQRALSSEPACATSDWQARLCAAFPDRVPLTREILTEELGSRLIASLYWTEATHPDLKGISQADFEFSCAPRLYHFLKVEVWPHLLGSSSLNWQTALQVVSEIGNSVEVARTFTGVFHKTTPIAGKYSSWEHRSERYVAMIYLQSVLYDTSLPSNTCPPQESHQETSMLSKFLDHLSNWIWDEYFHIREPLTRPIAFLHRDRYYHHHHGLAGGYFPTEEEEEYRRLNMAAEALKDYKEMEFSPAELSIETLQKLDKDWKIKWTADIHRHLSVDHKTLYLYWPSTALFRLNRPTKNQQLDELRRTYAIIFGTSSESLQPIREKISQELWNRGQSFCRENFGLFCLGNPRLSTAQSQIRKDPPSDYNSAILLKNRILGKLLRQFLHTEAPEPICRTYEKTGGMKMTIGQLLARADKDVQDKCSRSSRF